MRKNSLFGFLSANWSQIQPLRNKTLKGQTFCVEINRVHSHTLLMAFLKIFFSFCIHLGLAIVDKYTTRGSTQPLELCEARNCVEQLKILKFAEKILKVNFTKMVDMLHKTFSN